jgi:hypothetical protein
MVRVMTNVSFNPAGPHETVLPEPDPDLVRLLATNPASAVATHPDDPLGWADLGDEARRDGAPELTIYAYYRVGYHRGLDLLRKHGWKGSGHVRWEHPSNHGFLRCLQGLGEMAAIIGEDHEAERCREFLAQLDPSDTP